MCHFVTINIGFSAFGKNWAPQYAGRLTLARDDVEGVVV
jgi:hypothetical protein